ncbi:hypothetical protein ACIPZF_01235 [Pseudomonas sp. NPDC089752]|uniref:hypothetical protein n=1 Tax=Pseudomonas sp. NPDC089752 TaxID=3364472 RepID=UPI00381A9B74
MGEHLTLVFEAGIMPSLLKVNHDFASMGLRLKHKKPAEANLPLGKIRSRLPFARGGEFRQT